MRQTLLHASAVLALSVSLLGCSKDLPSASETKLSKTKLLVSEGGFTVEAVDSSLRYTNNTDATVYFMTFDLNTLALIAPCYHATSTTPPCEAVKSGEARTLPYATVVGYAPGHSLSVSWFALRQTSADSWEPTDPKGSATIIP